MILKKAIENNLLNKCTVLVYDGLLSKQTIQHDTNF